jgi:hypothetical protein
VYPKQIPVHRLSHSGFCRKPQIIFVRLNEVVPLPERVARIAAPAVIGRTLGDVGTHRVELDVPVTGEKRLLTLYQTCVIPTLPHSVLLRR